MAVNNEIGVVQPLEEIDRICHEKGVVFHADAAQALGKIPIDVEKMGIGLMSLSGHRIYGPRGDGGQERCIRCGTVPTSLSVGMGAACEITKKEMQYDSRRISSL
ncbi:unnamed protein product [Musa acuminata subsp. burmannicoides]